MRNIAPCGLNCYECEVYKATIEDSTEKKVKLAQKFTSPEYEVTPDDIDCLGCHKDSTLVFKFCKECELRICAVDKNVINCGYCKDYACNKLSNMLENEPNNKKTLDEIHKSNNGIYEFVAHISRLKGKIQWKVVIVPFDVERVFGTKSRVEVKISVDGFDARSTLLPSKKGHYFVFNKELATNVKKDIGDAVHVILQKDTKKRNIEIPEMFNTTLVEKGVLEKFNTLPNYQKREIINHIMDAKKDETKARRIKKHMERLQN